MKAYIHRSLLLLLSLALAVSVSACGDNPDGKGQKTGDVNPPEVLPKTQKLSVYMGDYFEKDFGDVAIRRYQNAFPEVELEITRPEYQSYNELMSVVQTLRTELAAGRGPDLIVSSGQEFADVSKTMKSGALLDLSAYMANDTELDRTAFVESVLDAGVFNEKQYIVPLSYLIQPIVTSDEALATFGVDKAELSTLKGLTDVIEKELKGNPAKKIFFRQRRGLWMYSPWSGVKMLDYAEEKVLTDSEEFKLLMEAYKEIYPQDWVNGKEDYSSNYGDTINSLKNGNHLFTIENSSEPTSLFGEYQGIIGESTPVVLPFPTVDGKTAAIVSMYATIRSNSENAANAYDFIKIMLSSSVQKNINLQYPILKEAISTEAELCETAPEDIINGVKKNNISSEDIKALISVATKVDYCSFGENNTVSEMVFANMEPFFRGDSDYEACLKKLTNQLAIYISE